MEKRQKLIHDEKKQNEEKISPYISPKEVKVNILELPKNSSENLNKNFQLDTNKQDSELHSLPFKNQNNSNNLNKLNDTSQINIIIEPKIENNINNNINININNLQKTSEDFDFLNNNKESLIASNNIRHINDLINLNLLPIHNKNQNFIRKDNYNNNIPLCYSNNDVIKTNVYNQKNSEIFQEKISINRIQINSIIRKIDIILNLLSNFKGSIYLQKVLFYLDEKEISILFSTIYLYINNIMCLEYGNYFIQKLIQKLDVKQKLIIYQIIEKDFLIIATNKSGTHSIQSLRDSTQTPLEQIYLDKLLNNNMLSLFNNENGYHIIMKIILERPENQRNNINLFLVTNIEKIAIDPYGSYCVCKFIINNSNLNLRLLLIQNIQNNIKILIFNKNSCSVLMLAIKKFGINNFDFILHEIEDNLAFLSLHTITISLVFRIL